MAGARPHEVPGGGAARPVILGAPNGPQTPSAPGGAWRSSISPSWASNHAFALNFGMTSFAKAVSCSTITAWGVPMLMLTFTYSRPG